MILWTALALAAFAAEPAIRLEPLKASYAQDETVFIRWTSTAPKEALVLLTLLPEGPNDDKRGAGALSSIPVTAAHRFFGWNGHRLVVRDSKNLWQEARAYPGRFRLRATLSASGTLLAEALSEPFMLKGTAPRARYVYLLEEALRARVIAGLGCETGASAALEKYSKPAKPTKPSCLARDMSPPLTGRLEACLSEGALTVTGSARLAGPSPCAEPSDKR